MLQALGVLQQLQCPPPIKNLEEPVEEDGVEGEIEKKSPKKTKKKNAKTVTAVKSSSTTGVCVYEAGVYKQTYSDYILKAKQDGASHKEALDLWRQSSERQHLLANMSESELKRRKFI